MGGLVQFMQSTPGRLTRGIAGVALIVVGLFALQGTGGLIVAIIGLIPLFAGLAGICLLAPLGGYTLRGKRHTGHALP